MNLLITLLLNALALLITAQLVKGFHVPSFTTAILAAIVIGLINTFIRPVLLLLTLPLNFLTLGLFTFVINAVVLWLASLLVSGLTIQDPISGLLAAVVLSVVSTILSLLVKDLRLGR